MAWLRVSDRAATHPLVLELAEFDQDDERLMHEALGWLLRCVIQSAAMATDGIVSVAVGRGFGGERTALLSRACLEAGLLEPAQTPTGKPAWRVVEDHDLFHWKTAEEIKFEKQRRQDRANPELALQVRARDGDACRYCGRVVQWGISRSGIGGTFDHREPGRAGTVETVVVSCMKCNSARGADPDADKRVPLLEVPSEPYFRPDSRKYINRHPWSIAHGLEVAGKRGAQVKVGNVPPGQIAAAGDQPTGGAASSIRNANQAGPKSHLASGEKVSPPAKTSESETDGVSDVDGLRTPVPTPGDVARSQIGPKWASKSDSNTHLGSIHGGSKSHLAPGEKVPPTAETSASRTVGDMEGDSPGRVRAGSGKVFSAPGGAGTSRSRRRSRGRRGPGKSFPSQTSGDQT